MAALHHLSIAPDAVGGWTGLALALEDDDIVVLLDGAARMLQQRADDIDLQALSQHRRGVRWLLPALERIEPEALLPVGIEVIDAARWLALICERPLLLEWN